MTLTHAESTYLAARKDEAEGVVEVIRGLLRRGAEG